MPTTTAATSQYECAWGPAWVRRSMTPLRDWLSRWKGLLPGRANSPPQ